MWSINGQEVFELGHNQIVSMIKNAGTQLQIVIERQEHLEKPTLQRKSHLGILFLGIVQPQSQFPHSCVCVRFIYSQDQSTYFSAAE